VNVPCQPNMFENFKTAAFYDLCIQESFFSDGNIEQSLKLLYDLGYRTIAINQTAEDGNIEPKKKKKKGEVRESREIVPVPYDLSPIQEIVKQLNLKEFQVFNRLTVIFSNQDGLHKIIQSKNFKLYHVLAALPTTMQALTFTCGNFEADILTYNPESKFTFRLSRKFFNQLVERGYHLELQYSHAIEDSTKRKNLIHASHIYHTYGKSKNIIFSSGAQSRSLIRNPYDVISLGFLFGLSELQCKSAVSHCSKKVILNSVGRRHGKAVMFVENISEESEVKNDIEEHKESDDDMECEDQHIQKKTKTVL